MQKPIVLLALLFGLSAGCAHTQRRENDSRRFEARWEMNSAVELSQDWSNRGDHQTTFEDGVARIGPGGEEWMQGMEGRPNLWSETVDPHIGFRIETRMRVVHAECGVMGLWIRDGARLREIFFCDGQVGIGAPFNRFAEVDTKRFHTYTIESLGDWVRILVDGKMLLFEQGEHAMNSRGTKTLTFGTLPGASGVGEWDWLSYETRPNYSNHVLESGATELL